MWSNAEVETIGETNLLGNRCWHFKAWIWAVVVGEFLNLFLISSSPKFLLSFRLALSTSPAGLHPALPTHPSCTPFDPLIDRPGKPSPSLHIYHEVHILLLHLLSLRSLWSSTRCFIYPSPLPRSSISASASPLLSSLWVSSFICLRSSSRVPWLDNTVVCLDVNRGHVLVGMFLQRFCHSFSDVAVRCLI